MKKATLILAAAVLAYVGFAVSSHLNLSAHADSGFTAAALKGPFSFEEQGTIGNNRFITVGLLNLDGAGAVSGTGTVRSVDNAASAATISGVYAVNPDGTGTMSLNYSIPQAPIVNSDDGTSTSLTSLQAATYNFVITSVNKMNAVRADGGQFVSASFEKQVQ